MLTEIRKSWRRFRIRKSNASLRRYPSNRLTSNSVLTHSIKQADKQNDKQVDERIEKVDKHNVDKSGTKLAVDNKLSSADQTNVNGGGKMSDGSRPTNVHTANNLTNGNHINGNHIESNDINDYINARINIHINSTNTAIASSKISSTKDTSTSSTNSLTDATNCSCINDNRSGLKNGI